MPSESPSHGPLLSYSSKMRMEIEVLEERGLHDFTDHSFTHELRSLLQVVVEMLYDVTDVIFCPFGVTLSTSSGVAAIASSVFFRHLAD